MEAGAQQRPLDGWIPWKALDSGTALAWLPLDDEPFHEPFFQDSLNRMAVRTPKDREIRTPLEALDGGFPNLETLNPALLIFHISRCGSTLLAQMLGTDPANVVLSEPPLLDHLLRQGHDSRVGPLLRLLGQKRFPSSKRVVLKLDSWHLAFHHRLRRLFPDTPFVLLYRDPAKVLASQQRVRGMHALPGVLEPSLFGFNPDQLPKLAAGLDGWAYLDAHLDLVLTRYFQWVETIARQDPNSLLLNFEEGWEACYLSILAKAGIDPGEAGRHAALSRGLFNAKRPGQFHQERPSPMEAPPHLQEAFRQVDELRRSMALDSDHFSRNARPVQFPYREAGPQ